MVCLLRPRVLLGFSSYLSPIGHGPGCLFLNLVSSLSHLLGVNKLKSSGMATSGQLNYCYAVRCCIQWILRSHAMEGPVPALLTGHLTDVEYTSLKRTCDDWTSRTKALSKLKKVEAPRRQRLSRMGSRKPLGGDPQSHRYLQQ